MEKFYFNRVALIVGQRSIHEVDTASEVFANKMLPEKVSHDDIYNGKDKNGDCLR